jgi:hypothetical protein
MCPQLWILYLGPQTWSIKLKLHNNVSSYGNITCGASDVIILKFMTNISFWLHNNVSSDGDIICWASDVIKLKFMTKLNNYVYSVGNITCGASISQWEAQLYLLRIICSVYFPWRCLECGGASDVIKLKFMTKLNNYVYSVGNITCGASDVN